MPPKITKTFSAWILDLATPESFIKMVVALCGLIVVSMGMLYSASARIAENSRINNEQDAKAILHEQASKESFDTLEAAMMSQVLNVNTLTVNQANIRDSLNEIKQLIRELK